jgi:hypothetical protein
MQQCWVSLEISFQQSGQASLTLKPNRATGWSPGMSAQPLLWHLIATKWQTERHMPAYTPTQNTFSPWPFRDQNSPLRLRAVPGHEGLAAMLDSLGGVEQQATMQEVQPYAGMTIISALQAVVVLNQATTIPLPTNEDWCQSVNEDHNLSRIVIAIQEGPLGTLKKAELVEKVHFEEWEKE